MNSPPLESPPFKLNNLNLAFVIVLKGEETAQ